MIAVIDNYDSFTYNLVQYIGELGAEVAVYRNDAVPVEELARGSPKALVISPGPGRPEDAGISIEAVRLWSGRLPILGVCLGHQAIGAAFGARIGRTHPLHGKASEVFHDGTGIFEGLEVPLAGGRYHSLVVEAEELPEVLEVTARTRAGIIMGIKHRDHPTYGVQFHPESILTASGKRLIANFLREAGEIARG